MTTRKPATKSVEKDVLIAARRRCCLCVYLLDQDEPRRGQIANLNRDNSDSRFENLVFLCLEHHDEYDSPPSQSKGFTPSEVASYRDALYKTYQSQPTEAELERFNNSSELAPLPKAKEYDRLSAKFSKELEFLAEPWRFPLWQIANQPDLFAYKAHGADGICLIERIDLPDGRIVVACIEIAANPGKSITNALEEICFQVCARFEIPSERLVWLEHYDDYEEQVWHLVEFERKPPTHLFGGPKWIEVTPAIWRNLQLRPKGTLSITDSSYQSKLIKLFPWPDEPLL